MKILLINAVCGRGSTGKICFDLCEALMRQGHECRIAYGRDPVPEAAQKVSVRIGSQTSVKIDALKTRLFDNAGFNSRRATKKFLEWVDSFQPDVIHLHNLHGYYIHVGMLFDYLKAHREIKVVWTLHDCWVFTGHCTHFDYVQCEKWKSACAKCPQKKQYPKSVFRDRSAKNYLQKKGCFTGHRNMTIVTPSEWLKELAKQSFLSEYGIEVVPNGIDTNVFCPTESDFKERNGLAEKKIVLGVANIWDKRKGLEDFLALSKILPEEYKTVLVGVSGKQRKKLPQSVLGLGRTNGAKELAGIYTAAEVFFNPTYEDTFSMVNLEALSCGTPVICYRTGGATEMLTEKNGIVLEKGNYEGVPEMFPQAEKLRQSAAENENFRENYSQEKMCEYYIRLYNE